MSAEKNPDWLVDLLYGEEEDGEAGASPPDLSEEQAELAARARADLDALRCALVRPAPSAATRTSILEQARASATKQTEQVVAAKVAPRRVAARPGTESLWARGRASSITQIALIALALIASAALLNRFQSSPQPAEQAEFHPAELALKPAAVEESESPNSPAADTIALNAPAPAESANDLREEIAEDSDSPLAQGSREELQREGSGAERLQRTDRRANSTRTRSASSAGPVPSESPSDYTNYARRAEAPAKKSKALNLDDGFFADSKKDTQTSKNSISTVDSLAVRDKVAESESVPMLDSAPAARGFNSPESRVSPPAAPSPEPVATSAPKPTAPVQQKPADPPPAPATKPIAEKAKGEAEEQSAASPKQAQAINISTIQNSFSRGDYRSTISHADSFLKSGQGDADQRAKAMELKARSLAEVGSTAESNRVWDDLEKTYPDYFSKNNLQRTRPARSPTRPSSRSISFDEASPTSY
jgi:hypothetical protein